MHLSSRSLVAMKWYLSTDFVTIFSNFARTHLVSDQHLAFASLLIAVADLYDSQ